MKVNIKKLDPNATIPSYAKDGDAAMDLVALYKTYDPVNRQVNFGTGLAFEIPNGYVGLIFPRSSIYKTGLSLANSVGVIDSGYRGEVKFKFNILNPGDITYNVGDKIGQIMIVPYPTIEFNEVKELTETERGVGGFGSSGV